jgi:hypothetical protein
MKWSISVFASVMALSAATFAAGPNQDDSNKWKGRDMTMRGCVQEGATKGHFFLANFRAISGPGDTPMPESAHGRKVVYWLEDLPNLKKYLHRVVEVKGEFISMKESQSDVKEQDGVTIVEFEGPGRDVDLTASQAREVVGTSGTQNDVKTFLVRVDVDGVKAVEGTCN